ncbi:hypothetical protein [Rhizobium sp. AAP43]|uniref:hypothetical protein n=1 Tax=Rhizobium sp. AAP43 TaxID=1523420 RepID=UPI0006B98785|nr:hypothetical protein [Rhizobium sp. AAP43]KPF41765.1 hypothetical protein IP76_19685 [Rhizobium sp. AAP43]
MKTKSHPAAKILRILCAMVFLSVGFAHRTPAAIATDFQSAAYSLPDGTFADLCIADRGHTRSHQTGDCEACRLAGAVLLPVPCDGWLISAFQSLGKADAAEARPYVPQASEQPRSRGPPLSA